MFVAAHLLVQISQAYVSHSRYSSFLSDGTKDADLALLMFQLIALL